MPRSYGHIPTWTCSKGFRGCLAGFYDIPVTGDWTGQELERIKSMVQSLLDRHAYRCIINHSGIELDIEGFDVIDARQGGIFRVPNIAATIK